MSKIAHTRDEYLQFLTEHPKVKALARRKKPRRQAARISGNVPKLVSELSRDKNRATAMTCCRRVMKYRREVAKIVHDRVKRRSVSIDRQIALIRGGKNIEMDFRSMIRASCAALLADPSTEAHGAAIASRPQDMHIFANPAFLNRSELAVIKYMGIEPKELSYFYETVYLPRRKAVGKILRSGGLLKLIARLEKLAPQIIFSEAPRYLAVRNILSLSGNHSCLAGSLTAPPTVAGPFIGMPYLAGCLIAISDWLPPTGPIKLGPGDELPPGPQFPPPGYYDEGESDGSSYTQWVEASPQEKARLRIEEFGYALGNMSRSKKELHVPNCPFLHLIEPSHLRVYESAAEGHSDGLDNCHYCIGGSLR